MHVKVNVQPGANYYAHVENLYCQSDNRKTEDNRSQSVHMGTLVADSLSAEMLRPYIDAGLVDEELMPAEGLSRGEKAVLAHDIAERLKIRNFWSIFERRWGLNYLSSDYNRFTKTTKFVEFQRRLNKIK